MDSELSNNEVQSKSRGDNNVKIGICMGFFMILNVINHILVLFVTGYLVYISAGSTNVWNLHVLFCSVGYVLLMAEGIVVLAGENVWSRWLTRRVNSHIHWIVQVIGAAFCLTGVGLAFNSRHQAGRPHFTSTHSLTGIISIGFLIASAFLGLPALFAARLRKIIKPIIPKFSHNLLGTLCFIVGMVSQCYGYNLRWMSNNSSTELQKACYYSTIIITILSLSGAAKSGGEQLWGLLKLIRR